MTPESPILTVTDLTRKIKQVLESGFVSVVVQGELSNVKRAASGHLYLTLKDEGAQLSGVVWRSRAAGLSFVPEDGMKVVATGRITVYEPRGQYQLDILSIRPLGLGELQAAFEKLKEKLASEGLFAAERKRPLPEFPSTIALVTSESGAVYHDMVTVFRRRAPSLTVILRPTKVQGAGAANDIAGGIAECNALGGIDLLIVGRGGGSLEDLWAFNEEIVARAIAASGIPVISAVGHEVDFTIADFVADLRAPTPTAAATMAVKDRAELLTALRSAVTSLRDSVQEQITGQRTTIAHLLRSYAFNRPIDAVRQSSQRFDEAVRSLKTGLEHRFALTRATATALAQRMASLNPRLVLKRGYAMVSRNGTYVSARADLHVDDLIDCEFRDGAVRSRVLEKK
jgi:exodeoxyribonuclease VII large subunit